MQNKWVLGAALFFYVAIWAFDAAVVFSRWHDYTLARRAFGGFLLVALPLLIWQRSLQLYRVMGRDRMERV